MNKWVRAHTNIALIKYWGKENEDLIIPKNNSLSLTLDAFYTDTSVTFDDALTEDELILDGDKQDARTLSKVQRVLDEVRTLAGLESKARIESINHVPTAAGLASSASGLAALAGAASQAAGLDLSDQELSKLARIGSGSASRSIFGGFAEWIKGHDHDSSYAVPVDDAQWDIGMLFIIVNDAKKDVSSRDGMKRTVETSPFYDGWLNSLDADLSAMKQAVSDRDIEQVGQIAERNALKMHATTLGASPPFTYWTAESMKAMDAVRALRKLGYTAYFTMDAGPNVKIICRQSDLSALKQELSKTFGDEQLIAAKPGPGLHLLN
ncbi:diphosphomevalonate decarboxylase [Alkalibacterium pelagium]|uniref:diphosphomevalonate decarboxylase n=1 Tax=Alkalibacterium pelagium TaxID=426702 RepID=A0A1H7EWP1_9LACT|nr:diphosphomevalonate decarboxylase [Alkalibacterium pelagium]GEN49586.1 diphosphomevalonate decarboxylase [Alkalibacterium pelagium]SEK18296.1 diphosphomevalonate decarboxylase [Alkalibacterium pelagium]